MTSDYLASFEWKRKGIFVAHKKSVGRKLRPTDFFLEYLLALLYSFKFIPQG